MKPPFEIIGAFGGMEGKDWPIIKRRFSAKCNGVFSTEWPDAVDATAELLSPLEPKALIARTKESYDNEESWELVSVAIAEANESHMFRFVDALLMALLLIPLPVLPAESPFLSSPAPPSPGQPPSPPILLTVEGVAAVEVWGMVEDIVAAVVKAGEEVDLSIITKDERALG